MAGTTSLFRNFRQGLKTYWDAGALSPFPLGKTLFGYKARWLPRDLRAGLNVALLALPQGMAYAAIADIPIAYGISCSAVAALVAPLFASSRLPIIGPTNATAFMLFSALAATGVADGIAMLPVLVLLVGLTLVMGAFFRMADLVQYISRSVIVGYLTGAAVLIIGNQLKHVLGVAPPPVEGVKTFFSIIGGTLAELGSTQWQPLVLGVVSFVVYQFGVKRFPALPVFAITLVGASGAAVLLGWDSLATFNAYETSELRPPFPDVFRPGFWSDVSHLIGIAFAIAFLASLEHSVMAKTLAARTRERPNLNQDMLALGATNMATAFLSGMPASGSLTRSALNVASGARTQVASLVSGALCLAGALTLGGYVGFVPKAALAALVIAIAVSLINLRNLRICLAATMSDAVTVVITVLATLILPLHVAIFVGVGVSIVLYLRKSARPELVEYAFDEGGQLRERGPAAREIPSISIVHVEGELFFGAAELFRTQMQRTSDDPALRIIILRMKNARNLDATSVMALEELVRLLRKNGRDLIVSGVMKDVYRVLKNSGIVEIIGRDNIFPGSTGNPNLATRNALIRAQQILGPEVEPEVKIYHDPNKPQE